MQSNPSLPPLAIATTSLTLQPAAGQMKELKDLLSQLKNLREEMRTQGPVAAIVYGVVELKIKADSIEARIHALRVALGLPTESAS